MFELVCVSSQNKFFKFSENDLIFKVSLSFAVLILMLFSMPAFAASPGDACTTTGAVQRDGVLVMVCDGANWQRAVEMDNAGNFGVGQTLPKAPLHVGGEVIIGAGTGLGCDADREGGMRYSSASTCFEFCDGTSWACIAPQTCADTTPDGFAYTDLTGQALSTLIESNIVQITGLGCTVSVQVSGEGTPQYRTCSDSGCSTVVQDWVSASGTIVADDYLQLRLTSSATGGDTYTAVVTAGNTADVWEVSTTGDCTGTPIVGSVCADGSIYAGQTPDGNLAMYVTRCDAGMTWDGSACTGSRFTLPWNDGVSGSYRTTGYTSYTTGESNTSGISSSDSNTSISGSQPHVAAEQCLDLVENGQSDWYLPARNEMNIIRTNRFDIGNFSTSNYWSSSEAAFNEGFRLGMSSGTWSDTQKHNNGIVRCARK